MKEFVNNPIYKQVISKENIFSAIYSLESYMFEVGLLSKEDIKLYYQLSDKYNIELIDSVIFKCRSEIERLFLKDELFSIDVFFKPKKLNDLKEVEYRPLHTADLYTQISIVSILNVIMFDDTSGQRKLSDIRKLAGGGSKTMLAKSIHEIAELSGKFKKTDDSIEEMTKEFIDYYSKNILTESTLKKES